MEGSSHRDLHPPFSRAPLVACSVCGTSLELSFCGGEAAPVSPAEVKEPSLCAHLGCLSLAPNSPDFVLSNLTKAMENRRAESKALFYSCFIFTASAALRQEEINLSKQTGPCYPGGFRCICASLFDLMWSCPVIM